MRFGEIVVNGIESLGRLGYKVEKGGLETGHVSLYIVDRHAFSIFFSLEVWDRVHIQHIKRANVFGERANTVSEHRAYPQL